MISLDKSKNYSEIFSSEPGSARFRQDGLEFDAAGILIGDPVEIMRERKEAAVAKARAELVQREADLNAEAKALDLSTPKVAPKPTFKKPGNQAADSSAA